MTLPRPQRLRWQPLRSGLLNLYRYDNEEFHYEDGHLLLRGNNGTGKSRVLALQLPFLLDGEVASHRMEPDRDPAKRVEWNLLMGQYPDRLGYSWIEFGRRDEEGAEHFLTLGCGLYAVSGRGLVDKWFFVTAERIGEGLFLHTPAGQALTRVRLVETLGERGEVFTTASEYRAAVDRRLFRLGAERYSALIDLLIQLRQPQLSRKLDEKRLSAALSEALPPLSPGLLDDVAEAFRSLEDDRLELERLASAERGVEEFLDGYRRYARIAARRRADRVRTTHATYEATQRRLRAAETRLGELDAELTSKRREIEELRLGHDAAEARVRVLEESPEMRDKKALDEARRRAEERRDEAERAARDLETARERAAARQQEQEAAEAAAAAAWRETEKTLAAAREAARIVGLETAHDEAVRGIGLPEPADDTAAEALERARQRLDEEVGKRKRQARLLAELEEALAGAEEALRQAKERQAESAAELDAALEQQRRAHAELEAASRQLAEAYRAWHQTTAVLRATEPVAIAEELESWIRAESGRDPVAEAVRRAVDAAFERLAAERAAIEDERATARATLDELEAEAERLRRGVHTPPPLAHTRSAEGRETRPGAPLFLLCDFAPELSEQERAGIEAALEAAGLLDAWLLPDGRLVEAGDPDAVLLPAATGERSASGPTLSSVLRPAAERPDPRAAAVDDAVIHGVLERIGYGAEQGEAGHSETWIDADGRFRLGPLHGSWSKDRARHLGASAREAERQRRLAELRDAVAEARDALAALDAALERNAEEKRRARREAEAAPSSDGILRARARIDQAAETVRRRRERLSHAERHVAEQRRRAVEARDERDATARDLGLADWIERPRALENAVGEHQLRLAALWPTLDNHLESRRRARAATERGNEARTDEERTAERRRDAETRARQSEAEHDALAETLGAAVEEVMRRLAAAREESRRLAREAQRADERRQKLEIESAVTHKDIENEQTTLERDAAERDAAVARLVRYAATRLLGVALPGLEAGDPEAWSITRTVEVARQIENALSTLDSGDAAWERRQRDIHQRFQTLLGHLQDHQPYSVIEDDLVLVLVPYQGRERTLNELLALLREDLTERRSILSAREREVLENHLVGEVATHLHERLHAAERWVKRINELLDSRPTSSGMKLRFAWHPADDGPSNFAEARRRLLVMGATWSPEDREALGDFLQGRIQDVHTSGEGTWREQLATALDYRAWHRFVVERRQDGHWKRLTRRTYGTGSGGEKAIALTLPQFAAAAAHYESADPQAPRFILLDEAFVGVDADMRAKCMGLLQAFELDFVMTSEREWGCYATLPGLAIYQLSTRPGIDAVGITRWIWNGHERRLASHAPPAEPPSTEPPSSEPPALSLT